MPPPEPVGPLQPELQPAYHDDPPHLVDEAPSSLPPHHPDPSPLLDLASHPNLAPLPPALSLLTQPLPMTDAVQTSYGQITPPDDHWKGDWSTTVDGTLNPRQFLSTGARKSSSGSSSAGGVAGRRVDKKDKYREKNRVAAAKCRAKKKEHTDGLEENHRTQSMLNALLKQTEQNLRDELSFWRTQALQHAFCDCSAVQEYNMKKARALAADKHFGGEDHLRRDSIAPSPSSKPGLAVYGQPQPEFDTQPA